MRMRLLLAPIALACLAALPARAQSLVELYEAARTYDSTFQSVQAGYDAATWRVEQARAGLLPQAGLTAGLSRTNADSSRPAFERTYTTQTAGINASQPLYRPVNRVTLEQSQRAVDVAQAQLEGAQQDLQLRVSQTYFDVLAAQDTLAFVRAQKAAVSEQLAAAKRNFEVGTATVTDSREAQARFDLVLAQEIAAENDLRVKRLALDQLVGRTNVQPHPLAAPLALPDLSQTPVEAWVGQAQAGQPQVRQAQVALDIARLETRKAEAGHKPTLDATAGYNVQRFPQGNTTLPAGNRSEGASVGLQFSLPLFAGFAVQNRVRETLSLEQRAEADLETARRNVAQATRAAYFGVISSSGQVRALEAAESSSQLALEANRLGYQVGVRINIDVLNAQSQLFQTKRDLAQARYNVLLGQLRLKQAAGALTTQDLHAINAQLVAAEAATR
jgi:outer membrane protein